MSDLPEPEDVFCPDMGHLCFPFPSATLSPTESDGNFIVPYRRSARWAGKKGAPGLHLLQGGKGSPEVGQELRNLWAQS